jgi:Ca-activated chloride channel family protein
VKILRLSMPLAWTLGFLIPTTYIVVWIIESYYGVAIADGSLRSWAALLLLSVPLVLVSRGWLSDARAPRMKISRVHDLAIGQRRGFRTWLRHLPTGARTVAVLLFVLALMGPQSIHARDASDVQGIDIVLTLDLSLSMQAEDITPNRFEATKVVVDEFVQRRPNDRIGAVVFGRDAYTLMPLTTDKEALRSAIAELELGMIDGRGTAIGNAVGTALNRLRQSRAESRVIILLTDGDSNSGNVAPQEAAEIARTMPHPLDAFETDQAARERRRGVRIYTIMMGAADPTGQRAPSADSGNFPINPELLGEMAESTRGEFFVATDRAGLERSFHQILDRLERSEIEDVGRVYGELYGAFMWPAIALLLLELVMGTLVLRRWP